MEKSEDVSDKLVMTLSKELIDEQPKIGVAVKNLIAMVIGRSISDPSANLLFGGDYIFTPEIGLACGRCLLQAIQRLANFPLFGPVERPDTLTKLLFLTIKCFRRFELLEPVSWGVTNDQSDDQTGKLNTTSANIKITDSTGLSCVFF
jgi:hypothetical protein